MAFCRWQTCRFALRSCWLLSAKKSYSAWSLAGTHRRKEKAVESAAIQNVALFHSEAVHLSLLGEDWWPELSQCSCVPSEISAPPMAKLFLGKVLLPAVLPPARGERLAGTSWAEDITAVCSLVLHGAPCTCSSCTCAQQQTLTTYFWRDCKRMALKSHEGL